ncbi:hypothetical protein BKA66DRAFT_448344 [Pyrenochaeta sp. MPI-SDFR-AT-0127]|nr:hypothetical protein BKA66DRAFT_448344 [Pyrenochaeta sp. MPI-SDFR-AT-0127]
MGGSTASFLAKLLWCSAGRCLNLGVECTDTVNFKYPGIVSVIGQSPIQLPGVEEVVRFKRARGLEVHFLGGELQHCKVGHNSTVVIVGFLHSSLSIMIRNVLDAPKLLAHQLKPALVLDSSGTVVAVNEGSVRLISPHQNVISDNNSSLIGKNIADLGFVPLPGIPPILWTWKGVLDAAFSVRKPVEGIRQNNNDCLRYIPATNVYSDTNDFWNQEDEHQSIVESDIYVTRHDSGTSAHDTAGSIEASSMIRVRATVHWYPLSKGGVFLITFSRTSLPQRPAPDLSAPATELINIPQETADSQSVPTCRTLPQSPETTSSNSSADLEGMMPSGSGIASSIIPYVMAVLDTDGQATGFSKSWYKLSGLSESGSLGSGWLTIMHPDDVAEMTIAWIDVLRNERSHWTYQARYRMALDGTYCWFLIRAQPFKDATGKVLRWYASMMDINHWVMARLQADKRRQSILTLFSQTDVMLWEIDKANHMSICEGQLNWDPTRIVKLMERTLQGQIAHTDGTNGNTDREKDEQLVHTIQNVLQGCAFSPVVEHWEGDRYFRTRFVAEHCSLTHDGTTDKNDVVEAAVALTFDITEEKARSTLQMENKRLVINEQAALDATNLKSRFLANMSHEIRTPVSGIIGLSEHLSDCGLTEEQMEFADSIHESAKFLLTLINDVLDFSKMESGHMDVESIPFSLCKLVSDALTPLRLQAEEKGLALNLDCDLPSDALFLGDPWRLRQILTNLIGNSLKFTKQGQVDLNVQYLGQESTETVMVQFVIHDSGVGISEEAMKPLFKPFSQADSSTARLYGGTGLGLVICQQLVELMGGHITLQSNPGEGTIATFNIPFLRYYGPTSGLIMETLLPHRAQSSDKVKRTVTRPEPSRDLSHETLERKSTRSPIPLAASTTKGHILLVEDNPINRKVIALAIKKLGYEVSINSWDNDLFDEHVRALPIIALTASTIKGDREKCWEVGMDDYLTKPAAREELKRTLQRWVGLKRPQASDRSKSAY